MITNNIYFNSYDGYWYIRNCNIKFVTEPEAIEYIEGGE